MAEGRIGLPRGRSLDLARAPLVMGVINLTPDSFWEGSRADGAEAALATARAMVAEGADILDLGGESTRPGSAYVSEEEELSRVVPALAAIRAELDVPISVDTRKAAVARAALDAGADIVNDVSALEDDPDMAAVAAMAGAAVVLMHKKGTPLDMQRDPSYADAPREILDYLVARARQAREAGISPDRIVLDPGIGFGKRVEDNLDIIKHLARFKDAGYPVLVGLSRKSFLGALTGRAGAERLAGTVAANAAAMLAGADIVRVHDVAPAVDAAALVRALRQRP